MSTGADAVASALRDAGVEVAFGLPGVHNLALWPAFERAGIRIVGARHEQGCAYAADGYARATGKLGVALVTTGPGAANTLGAVGEAWASHSPVLVIATDIPSTLRRDGVYRGVLHETTDQAALFAPVTKLRTRQLSEAIAVAQEPPAGPVYVEVPTDALGAAAPPPGVRMSGGVLRPEPAPIPASLPRRPLVWVGGGAKDAGDSVDAIARRLGAPVVTTYSARGVLPAGHPHLVPAPPHEPEVTKLVEQADCTIVIGSDLDYMNTMAWQLPLPAPRIAINIDPVDATKNYDFAQVIHIDAIDASDTVRHIERREPWFGDLAALGTAIRDRLRAAPETAPAVEFLERTEASLGTSDSPIMFADMCIAGYWLAGHLAVTRSRGLHYPMGWGTLGWAFPAGVGAAAGGTPTVCIVGDGGMLFAIGELAAVAQEQLPLTVVVVDDGGYGMLRFGHEHEANGSDLSPVDFVTVARGFGVEAVAIDGFGPEYGDALAAAVAARAPRLLHVRAQLYPPVTTSPRWPIRST
ncbi:MAG: thiamine pyrophosphate protein central region [Actinomycetia bacterium]|nr:thiamine pyrophosphate protein central region [Actinomycetes bacterium]